MQFNSSGPEPYDNVIVVTIDYEGRCDIGSVAFEENFIGALMKKLQSFPVCDPNNVSGSRVIFLNQDVSTCRLIQCYGCYNYQNQFFRINSLNNIPSLDNLCL